MYAVLVGLIVHGVAHSQNNDWIAFESANDGSQFLLRPRDAAQGPGTHDIWIKIDKSKVKATAIRHTMMLYRIDCSGQRIGVVSAASYKPDGSVAASKNFPYPTMSPVIPDTVGEELLTYICPTPEEFSQSAGQ